MPISKKNEREVSMRLGRTDRVGSLLVIAVMIGMIFSACGEDNAVGIDGTGGTRMGGAVQGAPLSLTGRAVTLAGAAPTTGSTDETGTAARFNAPGGIATDGTNLFVADSQNHTIRKVVIATREVTTVAGTAGSSGSADNTGAAARFNWPVGIATDGSNLYVTDSNNHTIRRVVIATGEVTTIAGTAGSSGSADGTGAAARFYNPYGIVLVGADLLVTDRNNHTIRKVVIATGEVTTFVGTALSAGSANGTGATARFNTPSGIATDGTDLYVADYFNDTIRKVVIATGDVTTVAGSAGLIGFADGIGAAARFTFPGGITMDASNLFVTDSYNFTVRKVVIATGAVSTIAGTVGWGGTADGTGAAAMFTSPNGITTDGTSLFVTETIGTIRKILLSTGEVTTFAGTAGSPGYVDGVGAVARFYQPSYVTTDGANLYVVERNNNAIRKIVIATGVVTTAFGGIGNNVNGITTDGKNLFLTEATTIRKVVLETGVVTTIAGGFVGSANGITTDGKSLFVTDGGHTIRRFVIATGEVTTVAAGFDRPYGITTDGTNLFVADTFVHAIRKVVIATGEVTTIAGTAGSSGSADGPGATAKFNTPYGITTDGTNLFVADTGNQTLRRVVIATGEVTTIAGTAGSSGSANGTGTAARFYQPMGITTDGGKLFVAEQGNQMIRAID
jgi:NHL repeat-containing protein